MINLPIDGLLNVSPIHTYRTLNPIDTINDHHIIFHEICHGQQYFADVIPLLECPLCSCHDQPSKHHPLL